MWSSFSEYVNQTNLVDVNFSLEMISNDKERAILKDLRELYRDIVLKA
jgi:hypothetical protein